MAKGVRSEHYKKKSRRMLRVVFKMNAHVRIMGPHVYGGVIYEVLLYVGVKWVSFMMRSMGSPLCADCRMGGRPRDSVFLCLIRHGSPFLSL